ncbi:hypothetical protein HDU97_002071 [Phlyctochytrium planicorne]|nr:hypothetical protein HDU97_002071 [Phlyctochytrium planicorne]
MSKADPITFFGGSSSQAKVDPYTISLNSSSSSSSASPSSSKIDTSRASSLMNSPPTASSSLHGLLEDKDRPDLATHLLESYVLSLVSSPLVVVETLAEVQIQRKDEDADNDSELAAYETVHSGASLPGSKIPILNGGVWDNVREVVESEGEGHFTGFVYNALSLHLQPSLEEALNDTFDVYDDSHPVTNVLSHVIIGGMLSPIELIRTRIIVQTSVHANKKYYGPIHAVAAVTAEEGGGLGALYATQHLIPSVILHGLRALLHIASSRIIRNDLGLTPDFNPVLHKFAVLMFLALEVGVVTPFEMARKRIQVQKLRSNLRIAGEAAQPFKASVEMSGKTYNGIWAAIYSIITEEGPARKKKRKASKAAVRKINPTVDGFSSVGGGPGDWQDLYDLPSDSPRRVKKGGLQRLGKYWSGIASLYRGFWARYATEVVKFAFQEIRESEEFKI